MLNSVTTWKKVHGRIQTTDRRAVSGRKASIEARRRIWLGRADDIKVEKDICTGSGNGRRQQHFTQGIQGTAEEGAAAGDGERNTKKSYSHIRQKAIEESNSFMKESRGIYPVSTMCRVLGVNHSTYYKMG